MKKSALAAASIAALAAAGAHAQSSVTLYGVIDAGIAYVHNAQGAGGVNQSTLVKFSSGNTFGSRWGLKGTEDLGGGLAAIFQLENGFNVGTGALGQGGREFGRKSVVGNMTPWSTWCRHSLRTDTLAVPLQARVILITTTTAFA
jgi:predicted porin